MVKKLMSIFNISVETANTIYAWAYVVLIFGAVLTVAGLLALFLAEGVRNKHHETTILEAQARSDEAKVGVAKANEALAQANERAAQARLEQERMVASNLELAAKLEHEKDARVRIDGGLSSRHVSAQQRAALRKALKGSNLTVIVSTYSDPEAQAYTNEIKLALKNAGMTIQKGSIIMAVAETAQGLFIEETASKIIDAFRAAGIPTEKLPATKNAIFRTGEGLNAILVGVKQTAF